jgi:mannan endo-1,4-beta-mannosidase
MYTLSNPNASKEAVELYAFLAENFGKKVITGVHTNTVEQKELAFIQQKTGKLPAICGFELLGYSPNVNYTDTDYWAITEITGNINTIDTAIAWAKEKKGIVTYTWHWYSPMRGHNKSFYTRYTDFNVAEAVKDTTPEHTALLRDLDMIADYLKRFRDLGIPILWRPLHEADGAWFWWGAQGPEACVKLYRLMYERFTTLHHLDNLIWVWNSDKPDWYPGDACVDIISVDVYLKEKSDRGLKPEYEAVKKLSPQKIIALAECGYIPNPAKMVSEDALWSWFMVWGGPFVFAEEWEFPKGGPAFPVPEGSPPPPKVWGSSIAELREYYRSPHVITLEDLPAHKKF